MSGWVKIQRDVADHPLFHQKPEWLGAWVLLISKANYDDRHIERGQVRISQQGLQKLFGWTRKKVRFFLETLEQEGMISRTNQGTRRGQIGAILTICNYSKFQDLEFDRGHVGAMLGPQTERRKKEEEDISVSEELTLVEPVETVSIAKVPIKEAVDLYNEKAAVCGLPQVQRLTAQRKQKLRSRLKTYSIDEWRRALDGVQESAFLCGQIEGKDWRADFDWLVRNDENIDKILAGKYGNGASHGGVNQRRIDELFQQINGESHHVQA